MSVLEIAFLVVSFFVLAPFLVFWIECWLAFIPGRRTGDVGEPRNADEVWVVIPAHNESAVIAETLKCLCSSLPANARVLVVADNCTDNTADVARDFNCSVIERHDLVARGKGFALQFAYQYLSESHSPSAVVIIDADCRVSNNLVSRTSAVALELNRPVQCLNLSQAVEGSSAIHAISELGFRFKNLIRPLGLSRLGMPCHLMGTGMAIPWDLLQRVDFQGDALAEDMQLGVELAKLGHPAFFCPEAEVSSQLPNQDSGFLSQRTRWEQGHLRTIITQVPTLLSKSLRHGRIDLFALGLDLIVPPFSFLMLLWLSAMIAASALAIAGAGSQPVLLLSAAGAMTALTILAGWWKFCRKQVPFRSLLCLPGYVLRKIPIYVSFLMRRGEKSWIRTERESVEPTAVVAKNFSVVASADTVNDHENTNEPVELVS